MFCYKVMFTKDVFKKKNRRFLEGILVLENARARLFDQQGSCVHTEPKKGLSELEIQQVYMLGRGYEITVDEKIPAEEFATGRIFIAKKIVEPPKKQNKAKKVKQDITEESQLESKKSSRSEKVQLEGGLQVEVWIYSQLRPHQIQGVNFMHMCLSGVKIEGNYGCILADFMGLGKTLQTLTLVYSMLRGGQIKKAVVVAPLTLVYVWQGECSKWLGSRLSPLVCQGTGDETQQLCRQFQKSDYRLLLISYQAFYRNFDILNGCFDFLAMDEGHRLKNQRSKMFSRIVNMRCKKRVLLTGTPVQNNLRELYACVSLVNPGVFGSDTVFQHVFQQPIVQGLSRNATPAQRQLAQQRIKQLADRIKTFSLRRRADILHKYLPERRQFLVFLELTPLQQQWYMSELRQTSPSDVLSFMNRMRKLFLHPEVYKADRINGGSNLSCEEEAYSELSYKTEFIKTTAKRCQSTDSKLIVVSYFTQTLDYLKKILCAQGHICYQLDGRHTSLQRRMTVKKFEIQGRILLLSGLAGGTGLTLVCATTMVIVEPNWNPSHDAQAMGRIWRQGQTQPVEIYRLITVSTFQQRVIQRQGLKKDLSQKVIDDKFSEKTYDVDNLQNLRIEYTDTCLTFRNSSNCLSEIAFEVKGCAHLQRIANQLEKAQKPQNDFQNLNFEEVQDEQKEDQQDDSDNEESVGMLDNSSSRCPVVIPATPKLIIEVNKKISVPDASIVQQPIKNDQEKQALNGCQALLQNQQNVLQKPIDISKQGINKYEVQKSQRLRILYENETQDDQQMSETVSIRSDGKFVIGGVSSILNKIRRPK